MPRTASAGLKTHLAGNVQTMARCWQIVRTDTTELYFTDHDADLVVGGNTYAALDSGKMSAVQSNDKLAVDNLDIDVILSATGIDEDDVIAGKYDNATLWEFEVNYKSLSDYITLAYGRLGEAELFDDHARVEFRGLSHMLQTQIGRTYGRLCDAEFGDSRCGLDLDTLGYKETGTVSSVTNRAEFTGSSDGGLEYEAGYLVWTSGANNGLEMEIKNFIDNDMVLALPMPFDISNGEGYTAYYGCKKTRAACKSYSNIVNHRGFPDMPGADVMLNSPNSHL